MSEDKDGGGRGRATMSIDIEEMVRMAGERAGWVLVNRKVITTPAGMDDIVTITRHTRDAQFIAKVPATITALHQQVQDLQAKVEQLEEEKRRLQIFLDEANDFMVNDSNQAKMLDQLKEQTQLLKGIKIT